MRRCIVGAILSVASTSTWAEAKTDGCLPAQVGQVLATELNQSWNQGTVRAWNETGELWSMPLKEPPKALTRILEQRFKSACHVYIADQGSFSARIMSKEEESSSPPVRKPIVSTNGTTIGMLSPGPNEFILLMYPARIASAIAGGSGSYQGDGFKDLAAKFSPELDIEYNFGAVQINILGAMGKASMREASDIVFNELRRRGYTPMTHSKKAVAAFDDVLPPAEHESFWTYKDGITRVELMKQKRGQVKVNLHETKQIR